MPAQVLLQRATPSLFLTQAWQGGGIEAPAEAVGATIDITVGISKPPIANRRTALRREMPAFAVGNTIRLSSNSALPSLLIANQTVSSLTFVRHSFSISFAIS
jgi:hypothetical protein